MSKSIELVSSLFVSVVILAVALGCDKDSSSKSRSASSSVSETPAEPELKVPAAEIINAYKGNEVAADSQYKNKVVEITGVVGDIKKDLLDDIYVTLGTGEQFEIPIVQCFLAEGMEAKAGSLKQGSQLTVTGRVDGLLMNVLVKECRF